MNNELADINRRIKNLRNKIYRCCKNKQSVCSFCFHHHHRIEDLILEKEKMKVSK